MKLGNFCVCLSVKDIHASKSFYEKFGFEPVGGNIAQNWIVLKNGYARIGLFQGMFEGNILTFNPGWDSDGAKVDSFTDIRDIQKEIKAKGIALQTEADENTSGPASFTLADPDGNAILFDQHV